MLKAILMVLLVVVSTGAAAGNVWPGDANPQQKKAEVVRSNALPEWVKIVSQKTYNIFVDPASIRKRGNNLEMLYIYELQIMDEVAGKPIRSVKAQAEYDCKNEQSRILSAAAYSGNMGEKITKRMMIRDRCIEGCGGGQRTGIVNRISEPGNWKPVTPGSTEELLMKFACGK
jgi:hypothetical protein